MGDGEQRGDYGAEDGTAAERVTGAILIVLVPDKEEDQKFFIGEIARPGGEEASEVPPPGSG